MLGPFAKNRIGIESLIPLCFLSFQLLQIDSLTFIATISQIAFFEDQLSHLPLTSASLPVTTSWLHRSIPARAAAFISTSFIRISLYLHSNFSFLFSRASFIYQIIYNTMAAKHQRLDNRVFGTYELLERIIIALLEQQPQEYDTVRRVITWHRLNRLWNNVIATSRRIQELLHLLPVERIGISHTYVHLHFLYRVRLSSQFKFRFLVQVQVQVLQTSPPHLPTS